MSKEERCLTPFVLWAQRGELILLRVQVQPSDKPDCTIGERSMSFKCLGTGASGFSTYGFELNFFDAVSTENCRMTLSAKEVEFQLLKKEAKEWPKLQSTPGRLSWLRLDFDRWTTDSSDEEEKGSAAISKAKKLDEQQQHHKKQLEEIEKELKKLDTYVKWAGVIRKAYLVIYNTIQWVGFCLVMRSLLLCFSEGYGGIQTTYDRAGPGIALCQTLAFLEIVHSVVGLVKGGVAASLLQVTGRAMILFIVLGFNDKIHTHPVVWCLFFCWSLVELIRYPYYALSVVGKQLWPLTWLRYSIWIPLYPLGIFCEAIVVWLSIPSYSETSDPFDYPLPNVLNISFHYATFLWCYLLLVLPMGATFVLPYMMRERTKRLGKAKTS